MGLITLEELYSKYLQCRGVSIDTRTVKEDDLFFALKGPNFDANQFAAKALEQGAKYAVIDDPKYDTGDQTLLVPKSEQTLQALARHHRNQFKNPVLGITGSNGKTTTKELINRVLGEKFSTHATVGNYNNHLGVPLTLLHLDLNTDVAIIEMGANHIGEIAFLSEIAQPTHGLITNIGEAHTELFGGIEGVLRGKSELFDFLRKSDGIPFINVEDFRLANMSKRFNPKEEFPSQDLKLIDANPFLKIELDGISKQTQLIGRYNFPNIAAAVALGRHFGVSDEQILHAIATYVPSNQRSQIIENGSLKIISDCYNANPTSMRAALDNLNQMTGKKAVILGDMKEVENAVQKHQEIGNMVADMHLDLSIFIGTDMKAAYEIVKDSHWYQNADEAISFLKEQSLDNLTLLVKGSRSNRLDKVVESLS